MNTALRTPGLCSLSVRAIERRVNGDIGLGELHSIYTYTFATYSHISSYYIIAYLVADGAISATPCSASRQPS